MSRRSALALALLATVIAAPAAVAAKPPPPPPPTLSGEVLWVDRHRGGTIDLSGQCAEGATRTLTVVATAGGGLISGGGNAPGPYTGGATETATIVLGEQLDAEHWQIASFSATFTISGAILPGTFPTPPGTPEATITGTKSAENVGGAFCWQGLEDYTTISVPSARYEAIIETPDGVYRDVGTTSVGATEYVARTGPHGFGETFTSDLTEPETVCLNKGKKEKCKPVK